MSSFVIGSLYVKNNNGIAWSQPGGPGTTVYPQQNNGPFTAYPVPGQFFGESSQGLWRSGCGHGWDCMSVWKDYDEGTEMSAAIFTCPLCAYLIRVVEPYSLIENPVQYAILIP